MASYVLVLKDDDYLILLENSAPASDGHTALLGARNPTPSHNRGVICSEKAVKELLDTAQRVCREATTVEISKQIQRQKTGPQ